MIGEGRLVHQDLGHIINGMQDIGTLHPFYMVKQARNPLLVRPVRDLSPGVYVKYSGI